VRTTFDGVRIVDVGVESAVRSDHGVENRVVAGEPAELGRSDDFVEEANTKSNIGVIVGEVGPEVAAHGTSDSQVERSASVMVLVRKERIGEISRPQVQRRGEGDDTIGGNVGTVAVKAQVMLELATLTDERGTGAVSGPSRCAAFDRKGLVGVQTIKELIITNLVKVFAILIAEVALINALAIGRASQRAQKGLVVAKALLLLQVKVLLIQARQEILKTLIDFQTLKYCQQL